MNLPPDRDQTKTAPQPASGDLSSRDLSSPDPPSPDLLARFSAIVGREHALIDPDLQLPYLREWRDQYVGKAALVLRPNSTAQVSAIMALAHETSTKIVPQSGNTGLVGGQIPHETGTEIVLSLQRMNRIRSVDEARLSMICEAGVTLEKAQAAAEDAGRMFALNLPSKGSCCIGGNIATNAGGVNVLAYGNARAQILGLEVVLADGRIWNGLRSLKKDNTGYDLKDLFIGSEGTLGIITAAVVKLLPRPLEQATALVGFHEIDQALQLFIRAQEQAGGALTAFELMDRRCIDFVLAHSTDARDPLNEPHQWYALLELSGLREDGAAAANMEALLEEALEGGLIADAAIATSPSQSLELWRLRENISESQKPQGGSLKHDISVPITKIPQFIKRANALVEKLCPGARPVPFGHFGDGNIHYNVSQPAPRDKSGSDNGGRGRGGGGDQGDGKAAFLARRDEISDAVHALVVELDGSISAEHGIGRLKRAQLRGVKSEVEMDMMRALKSALDPTGILNPGKLL